MAGGVFSGPAPTFTSVTVVIVIVLVLLAITRMPTLSVAHPIQQWIFNALRVGTENISYRSNLESVLHQFPHMTESIESIEPFIRWKLKAKKKSWITQKTQELPNSIIATIYTDGCVINALKRSM
jgi:hypothetical protein